MNLDAKLTKSSPIGPSFQILLSLDCHTLEKIYQQLNADARNHAFEQLQLTIKKVLALYSGQQVAATTNTLIISFKGKDKKECLFNALCCAYLLRKVGQKQQWLIRFSSLIHDSDSNITTLKNDHKIVLSLLSDPPTKPSSTISRTPCPRDKLSPAVSINDNMAKNNTQR